MWHTPLTSVILEIFFEGKAEVTGKQPKRSELTLVKLKILQGSKNHKHHGDFKFQFVYDLAGPDHSKATLAYMKGNLPFSIEPPIPQMLHL